MSRRCRPAGRCICTRRASRHGRRVARCAARRRAWPGNTATSRPTWRSVATAGSLYLLLNRRPAGRRPRGRGPRRPQTLDDLAGPHRLLTPVSSAAAYMMTTTPAGQAQPPASLGPSGPVPSVLVSLLPGAGEPGPPQCVRHCAARLGATTPVAVPAAAPVAVPAGIAPLAGPVSGPVSAPVSAPVPVPVRGATPARRTVPSSPPCLSSPPCVSSPPCLSSLRWLSPRRSRGRPGSRRSPRGSPPRPAPPRRPPGSLPRWSPRTSPRPSSGPYRGAAVHTTADRRTSPEVLAVFADAPAVTSAGAVLTVAAGLGRLRRPVRPDLPRGCRAGRQRRRVPRTGRRGSDDHRDDPARRRDRRP